MFTWKRVCPSKNRVFGNALTTFSSSYVSETAFWWGFSKWCQDKKICFCFGCLNDSHFLYPFANRFCFFFFLPIYQFLGLWLGWKKHLLPCFTLVQICEILLRKDAFNVTEKLNCCNTSLLLINFKPDNFERWTQTHTCKALLTIPSSFHPSFSFSAEHVRCPALIWLLRKSAVIEQTPGEIWWQMGPDPSKLLSAQIEISFSLLLTEMK